MSVGAMGQKMRVPKLHQSAVPQFGVIKGGVLDGWQYTLKAGSVEKRRAVLSVQAQPPGWPFPPTRTTKVTRKDFERLEPILPVPDTHWVKPRIINVRRLMLNAVAAQAETA